MAAQLDIRRNTQRQRSSGAEVSVEVVIGDRGQRGGRHRGQRSARRSSSGTGVSAEVVIGDRGRRGGRHRGQGSARRSSSGTEVGVEVVIGDRVFGIFDCCINHTTKKFKVSQVGMFENYYIQDSLGVCDMDAVVFTVNSRPCSEPKIIISLCADRKQMWVKNMMEAVDKQAKKNKKQKQRNVKKLCKRMKKRYA
ncbi:uncharacterized protein ACNLHF_014105 [Anomaloglossus baeobatrachus]